MTHFWWQLDTYLLDTLPLRDVEGKCLGDPQLGWPNSKLVSLKAASGRGCVNVIVGANCECEETLQYKF